jgi:hypothetical protein
MAEADRRSTAECALWCFFVRTLWKYAFLFLEHVLICFSHER